MNIFIKHFCKIAGCVIAAHTLLNEANLKAETFADIFKPLEPQYLYNLVDDHPESQSELNEMFRIESTHNIKERSKNVIAYSLFWKSPLISKLQPKVSPTEIHSKGLALKNKNRSFFELYVKPLLEQLKTYDKFYPGWVARVYLAHDLAFLLPEFLKHDAEVFIMASNSIAAAPGSMWRFLVFDDPLVQAAYIRDADMHGARCDGDFSASKHILAWINAKETNGFFRLRDIQSMAQKKYKRYSPIIAGAFGAKNIDWINVEKAMKGFILHKRLFKNESRHHLDFSFPDHPNGFGNEFPNYGFDERFLKHVIYFAAAKRDQLTLITTDTPENRGKKLSKVNHLITLDLEFTNYKIFGDY